MDIQVLIDQLNHVLVNWPLFIFVMACAVVCTVAFQGIQFRYFTYAWKQILFPSKSHVDVQQHKVDMTPMQAFINTLSSNLGNGAITGVAVGIYAGGPGSAFWLVVFGLLLMVIRFAEAFLSMHFAQTDHPATSKSLGGPMLYLRHVAGGPALAWIYAVLCFLFGMIGGNSIQTNAIRSSLGSTFGLSPLVCAVLVTLFILYIVFGGAQRIIDVSVKIVPIKVIVFFGSTLIILAYHYKSIGAALTLIGQSAFTPTAAIGGVLGFSVQQAVRLGMLRAVFSTEAGLGTAAVLFGFTGSKKPVSDAIVSMLSVFISTLVCFIVALCIVASGVWDSGLTSTDLTTAAFQSVFGDWGSAAVTFLVVSFGTGVLVTYAYITLECWLFLTGGRYAGVFNILYCMAAFAGAMMDAGFVWDASSSVLALMLIINLWGLVSLIPLMRKNVIAFRAGHQG